MKVISVSNQKGGCGKTTTSVNLAAALAQAGRRVLLIDLDPQGHATLGVGLVPQDFEKTIYNVIVDPYTSLDSVITDTKYEGLYVAPSNVLLSGAEPEITPRYGRERLLRQAIENMENMYDFCIIDCSPSLSLLTLSPAAPSGRMLATCFLIVLMTMSVSMLTLEPTVAVPSVVSLKVVGMMATLKPLASIWATVRLMPSMATDPLGTISSSRSGPAENQTS